VSDKIELGKEYETRGGDPVGIYAVGCGGVYSVHGYIDYGRGVRVLSAWTADGLYALGGSCGDCDLVPASKRFRAERWVNVYSGGVIGLCLHDTPDMAATAHWSDAPVACVKVVIEGREGDGVEGGAK